MCPFLVKKDARRVVAFYPRVGILTDLTGSISILQRSFYRTVYTDLLSLVIGFARHCVASVREISARDRSFQPSEKFMSCTGRKNARESERGLYDQ